MKQQKKGYFSGETNKEIFAKKYFSANYFCKCINAHSRISTKQKTFLVLKVMTVRSPEHVHSYEQGYVGCA